MTKRFTWNSKEVVIDDNLTGNQLEVMDITEIDVLLDLLNGQHIEIEELKKEVEMLRNGLKAYNEALPLYLDCEDIMHFNSELFEFEMERMDFYKKYPNRIHYK